MASLTAANAIIVLTVPPILPVPHQLQGFAADDVFDTEALNASEESMGVDGILSAGFVFEAVKQGYTLQGDSRSNVFFDAWYYAEQQAEDKFPATGTIVLPGIGVKYAMIKGFLKSYKPLSDAKKIIQPRKYMVLWERASPSII